MLRSLWELITWLWPWSCKPVEPEIEVHATYTTPSPLSCPYRMKDKPERCSPPDYLCISLSGQEQSCHRRLLFDHFYGRDKAPK